MAEDSKLTGTTGEASGFDDVQKNNEEVAAKLAAQDISGHSTAPKDSLDASSALDDLAKAHDDAAKKKADEIANPAKIEEKIDDAAQAAAKVEADKAAAEVAAAKTRADLLFKDSPGLPPGASPKSSESFNAIKIKAAQEISRAEAELEKLRKENADLTEKSKNSASPEALKELEDHRQWRAKLDVETDPKFKEFDKKVSETHEFIYAQLKRSPAISADVIEAIKKHGGPENVQMDKIFEAIKDPAMQRMIEVKLADIETAKYNKSQAIDAAKNNVTQYLADREKLGATNATAHNTNTEKHFNELTTKLEWYKEKTAAATATEDEKKLVASHNAFVAETKKNLAAAVLDDSPEMRAIMLAGMAQLFYLQNVHASTTVKLAAAEKAAADATAKYDKLRAGSVTRLRESVEIPGGKSNATMVKASDQFTQTATESLDKLRDQVTAERERASAAGGK